MIKSIEESKREVKDKLQGSIDEMERALKMSENCLECCNFIIMCDGIAIDIETDGKKTTGVTTTGMPHSVSRFTEIDAINIAKNVRNGRKSIGYSIGWKQATRDKIKATKESIELICKHE